MNPLQGSNQVGVANIGGIPIFFYAVWGKVQIAQNIQTVIYTYDNNIAKFGKILTIVGDLFNGRTIRKPSAVEPDQDRLFRIGIK